MFESVFIYFMFEFFACDYWLFSINVFVAIVYIRVSRRLNFITRPLSDGQKPESNK